MKVNVPTEEEYKRDQKRNRIHGIFGLLFGLLFFGLAGTRIFRYGFDEVEIYTWIALGLGIVSFGWLAYTFGETFWKTFIRT
jgi:hypothetical protein